MGGQERLASHTVYSGEFDAYTQHWWFATSKGVYFWNKVSNEIKLLDIGIKKHSSIRKVFYDRQGRLWVGGEKVFGYYKNNQFTEFNAAFFNLQTLPVISHILQISDDTFWFGSTFQGAFEYDEQIQVLTSLEQYWQTSCQTVYFFESVSEFNVIGCPDGKLVRFNASEQHTDIFDANDGLISEELTEGAAFYQPNVGLFVGVTKGIMVIDVPALSNRVENNSIFVAQTTAYYSDIVQVNLLPNLYDQFAPNAGLISFQIASQNYLDHSLRDVKYRLINKNSLKPQNYIPLTGQATLNLSGLNSGSYTLQLVSPNNGKTDMSPYEYHFTVTQMWWHSEQFKTLLAFLLFVIGVLFVLRHQHKTEKFKTLNDKLLQTQDRLQQALRGSESDLWEWHVQQEQFTYRQLFKDHL